MLSRYDTLWPDYETLQHYRGLSWLSLNQLLDRASQTKQSYFMEIKTRQYYKSPHICLFYDSILLLTASFCVASLWCDDAVVLNNGTISRRCWSHKVKVIFKLICFLKISQISPRYHRGHYLRDNAAEVTPIACYMDRFTKIKNSLRKIHQATK